MKVHELIAALSRQQGPASDVQGNRVVAVTFIDGKVTEFEVGRVEIEANPDGPLSVIYLSPAEGK